MALTGKLVDRDKLVRIGRIRGAHGMGGDVKVTPFTDATELYEALPELVLDAAKGLRAVEVAGWRHIGAQWVLSLKDVTDRDGAEALRGAHVLAEPQTPVTAEDEYLAEDLIGCAVETMSGEAVGSVSGVLDAGPQALLQVTRIADAGSDKNRGEVLVPLADTIVKEVNLDRRRIRIDPPPGLLELNAP
jgi:16S rRNA processing protein RimM